MLYSMWKWFKLAFIKVNASQLVTPKSQNMKINVLLFLVLFFFVFQFQEVQSKNKQGTHTFKIVGSKKISMPDGKKTVAYDPESNNHLYISYFGPRKIIEAKRQFLFTGKKFRLAGDYLVYKDKGEIQIDGSHTFYNKDGSIYETFGYNKDTLVSQIFYYPDGQKQILIPGNNSLNGEYKRWYPNGQLSFSGYFKDNLKNGDFEQFDESGTSIKKGVYKKGTLVSGEKIVADIIYTDPEIPAKYAMGEEDLNHYLTKKVLSPDAPKMTFIQKVFSLYIAFDKNGKIFDIKNATATDRKEEEFIKYLLNECPAFSPALVEGIPVQSQQPMTLLVSMFAARLNAEEGVYDSFDEKPEFPGGSIALRDFISSNLQYPAQAQREKIQGKVYVNFIVNKDGSITSVTIARGVYYSLDEEAIRVVGNMPKWTPGIKDGKPVRVSFTVPINFMLQ